MPSEEPLNMPIFVYDGSCPFCCFWAERWQRRMRDNVAFFPYQKLPSEFQKIPQETFAQSVIFIFSNKKMVTGAHAVFTLFQEGTGKRRWLFLYHNLPGFTLVSEGLYRLVSSCRVCAFRITKFFFRGS
ncbi:MAG: hypothetical protein UU48_C0002G0020 [Candidatus Uhrbacteria bacterium GW2011_GWF2_41_16]|jgi:predicted DCC family thiol-disulfide oxidoreductase YuxK|uniref:Thiol-disulfide oxidoreductase DCC n=2 Tax=Candidatus Uhriibacteriota TaxID=1752732 RepID=A0A0G0XNV1_9BACT|nr:MAG: hypothetical protein UU31_C0003G0028 [Candidatus Uhrbacteria bacterium GW2011_GWA2_41_10]KKR87505.1 MAG: hypothetical protein UU35_C0002G0006 [Candidatus Uhrbacteria bacterium GW2011_GWC2_41_11]KKR98485.1 MAG: hypothetical protein UU48_C0002G0020 [Candidatus Uhrbacteria bacterium GW2011_GWF2_41_16]HBO99979.1 hypothetical protein [Candidatus Uhrbacteria bacterium]